MMDFLSVPGQPSSNSQDGSNCDYAVPCSSRRTSHTGKQTALTGLGYGFMVAWHHLRPFIPFFLISCLVVALLYLLQSIVYGGPFTDPMFFVKFNERWPKPDTKHPEAHPPSPPFSPIPSGSEQELLDIFLGNGTL